MIKCAASNGYGSQEKCGKTAVVCIEGTYTDFPVCQDHLANARKQIIVGSRGFKEIPLDCSSL